MKDKGLVIGLVVFVLATAGLCGLAFYQQKQIHDLRQEVHRLELIEKPPLIEKAKADVFKVRRVAQKKTYRAPCPLCKEEGKMTTHLARGKESHYPCPVCKTKGSREIKDVPADYALCTKCIGMGSISVAPTGAKQPYTARICVPCNGRGILKIKK